MSAAAAASPRAPLRRSSSPPSPTAPATVATTSPPAPTAPPPAAQPSQVATPVPASTAIAASSSLATPPTTLANAALPSQLKAALPVLQQQQQQQQRKDELNQERYRRVFEELDLNANGSLDEHEIQAGLQKMGLPSSDQQVHEMMTLVDADKDGSISYGEFASFAEERERELRELFDEIDLNGNGLIEPNEIRVALDKIGMSREVSDDAIVQLIDRMGVDHSKGIDFQVFKRILMLFPSRTLSIHNVFDYWFRQIIDTGDEVVIPDMMDHPMKRLIAGGFAGAVSRTATAPFDRLKILLQAQNSPAVLAGVANKARLAAVGRPATAGTAGTVVGGARPTGAVRAAPAAEYRGIWNSLKRIYVESGWKGFYKGNGTNIIKIAPESAVKFWAYETMKRMLCRDSSAPAIKEKLIAGSTAGAISQTVIYPLEITKTRLAVAAPGEYRGIMHCIASIVKNDGFSALFRGLVPSVVGVIPYAGVDFAVYSSLRDVYTRRYPNQHPGVLTVFVCGAISSTCGQVVAYPLQLVRTRLQTQGMAGRPMLYAGTMDAFYKIWKCDGLLGFYSGILPNFMKAIPAVSISYIVYEQVSRGMGISSGL